MIVPGSPKDAPPAARLIAQTAPGLVRLLAAGEEETLLKLVEHEWQKDGGIFASTMAQVVRNGDEVLAVLISYTERQHVAMDFIFAAPPERVPPDFVRRVNDRNRSLSYLFPAVPQGAYYVQNIAVATAARRQGLGRALLEWAFADALRHGCAHLHLDVEQEEEEEVRFYEQLGLQVLVETTVRAPGVPRYYRMVKEFCST
jgi:ribosomal protein S18 acetylase RimI-like enzyme